MNRLRLIQAVAGLVLLVVVALLLPRNEEATTTAPEASASAERAEVTAPAAESSDFDYYVLVLSWSPTHCASDDGRGRDDDLQCRGGRPFGFVLHGLWPQYERGYPQDCPSDEPRTVADDLMERMLAISPSEKLVQHEWVKHGTCSGLSQRDYVAKAEKAFGNVVVPPAFAKLAQAVTTTPDDVRASFVASTPQWPENSVAATCRRNELAEVWVCLDKQLSPRACSKDVSNKHCGDRRVRMRAMRGDWPR